MTIVTVPGADLLRRYADLVVGFGSNVQPGQIVAIWADVGKEDVARGLARAAYERGALFVDVSYFDQHVKRARLELAAEETIDFVPTWYGRQVLEQGERRAAWIALAGPPEPDLFHGIDPARLGRDQLPLVAEVGEVINDRTVNWTAAPCPTAGWAADVYPLLDADDAHAQLWTDIVHVLRLDEVDPIEAWRSRFRDLALSTEWLNDHRFDALHFGGPGTDLTIGLLSSSTWASGSATTVDGIEHVPNLPTEECYTAPDPTRVDGIVRATRPLDLMGMGRVKDFSVRFEAGRAVEIEGGGDVEALRARAATDEGAARLGEVALVDAKSRVGGLGVMFGETLMDENTTSHVALGNAYASCADGNDRSRINASAIHVDFMIGGDDVNVTGITRDDTRVPVLLGGVWQM